MLQTNSSVQCVSPARIQVKVFLSVLNGHMNGRVGEKPAITVSWPNHTLTTSPWSLSKNLVSFVCLCSVCPINHANDNVIDVIKAHMFRESLLKGICGVARATNRGSCVFTSEVFFSPPHIREIAVLYKSEPACWIVSKSKLSEAAPSQTGKVGAS